MEQYVLGVAAAWKQIAALRRETDLLDHHHHIQPQELTIRQAQGVVGAAGQAAARPLCQGTGSTGAPVRPNRN